MSDKIDPSVDNNKKEETVSLVDSFNDSSSLVISTTTATTSIYPNMNNSSANELNSSTLKTKKTRSRKTDSRPIRNRIVKDSSIKNEPYTIPYSTRSQTQQLRQQDDSLTETSSSSTIVNSNTVKNSNSTEVNPQVPVTERKRHCAKCKESTNIVKMINSKMGRIEELVKNLKKVTDEFTHDVKNNNIDQSILPSSTEPPSTSFKGIDFSKMSVGDLQNFVIVVTNTIITNNSKITKNSNLSVVKLEFKES